MTPAKDEDVATYRAKVDQQDGGPASHTEDASGGEMNDVASGGVSECRNEQDASDDESPDADEAAQPEQDVHGEADTVS